MQVEASRRPARPAPTIWRTIVEERAFGVVVLGRHRRAVRADIDPVERQRGLEAGAIVASSSAKNACSTGPFGSLIASTMPTGCHGPAASIAATKPGVSGSIVGVVRARLADDVVAFEIGAGDEMRLRRRRREFVALDREAEHGDARVGGGAGIHAAMLSPDLRTRSRLLPSSRRRRSTRNRMLRSAFGAREAPSPEPKSFAAHAAHNCPCVPRSSCSWVPVRLAGPE